MRCITWSVLHELGALVELHIVDSHLHRAEQVICHRRHMDGLMYHKDYWLASCRAIICQGSRHEVEILDLALSRIESCDIDLLIQEMDDQCVSANNACVGVTV